MDNQMNKPSSYIKEIGLVTAFIGVTLAMPVYSQELQDSAGQSPLFEGEQLLLSGSYAAAADIFQMADGLDRYEGIVGASRAFFMMGNSSEAINIIEEIIEDEDYASRPLVSTQLAEVKRAIGQSSEALAILSSVVDGQFEPPVRTLVQYGSLLKLVGRKIEAEEALDCLLYTSPSPRDRG